MRGCTPVTVVTAIRLQRPQGEGAAEGSGGLGEVGRTRTQGQVASHLVSNSEQCQHWAVKERESGLVDCALASQTFRGLKVLKDNQVQPTHFRAEATEDMPRAAEGQCPARTSGLLREPHFFINEAPQTAHNALLGPTPFGS